MQTNRAISWTGSLARECERAWQRYALNPFQPAVPPSALINEHPRLYPLDIQLGAVAPRIPGQDRMLILALDSSHTEHITHTHLLLNAIFMILIFIYLLSFFLKKSHPLSL